MKFKSQSETPTHFHHYNTRYRHNTTENAAGYVRNVAGTSADASVGGSFIRQYTKVVGARPKKCIVSRCKGIPTDGAHVKFADSSALYLAPECAGHNRNRRTDYHKARKNVKVVKLYSENKVEHPRAKVKTRVAKPKKFLDGKQVGMAAGFGALNGVMNALQGKDVTPVEVVKQGVIGAGIGLAHEVARACHPVADVFLNLAIGVGPMIAECIKGNIPVKQCVGEIAKEGAKIGLYAVGNVIGNLIPVPVIGQVVGMLLGEGLVRLFGWICKKLNQPSRLKLLVDEMQAQLEEIRDKYKEEEEQIRQHYESLHKEIDTLFYTFDLEFVVNLTGPIEAALAIANAPPAAPGPHRLIKRQSLWDTL